MASVGQKLYLLRIRKGVTQSALSGRSGIPQANLSKIEQGKQDPTVSTLLKICLALGVRPSELFEERIPNASPPLTRASAERIAKGVLDPARKLSRDERKAADLLRDLVPGFRKRRLPSKKLHSAWYELKSRLSGDTIRMLAERVREEQTRRDAEIQKDYGRLLAGLRKILGRG